MSNLPEPLASNRHPRPVHPSLVRAAVSPAAVAVTAAGALIGLAAQSVALAVVLAVCAWLARMAVAVVSRRRRERAARPRPAPLDPWSVPEPWRQLLQQALSAQTRFDQAVAGWPAGPTRDRLLSLQPLVYEEVARLGVTARHGAAAGGWTAAGAGSGRPSAESLTAELRRLQDERTRLGDGAPARSEEIARREASVAEQLRAVHRGARAEAEMQDRLRRAVARLDQTVTDLLLVEPPPPLAEAGTAGSAIDQLSDGITTLRQALMEAAGPPPVE